MKIRIAAAIAVLGMAACQPDREQDDAAPEASPGDAVVRSTDAQTGDYPFDIWGDLPASAGRDSAGIRIVENASPVEGSRLHWVIGPEPDVTNSGTSMAMIPTCSATPGTPRSCPTGGSSWSTVPRAS